MEPTGLLFPYTMNFPLDGFLYDERFEANLAVLGGETPMSAALLVTEMGFVDRFPVFPVCDLENYRTST